MGQAPGLQAASQAASPDGRKKVKSGRYKTLRLGRPTAEDILSDLTAQQLEGIHQRIRASIGSIAAGEYREYEGREGLKKLADGVKVRGRRRLREASGQ